MSVVTSRAEAARQYPLCIYREFFRTFPLFVIPVGAVTHPPDMALPRKTDPLGLPERLAWCSPLWAAAFLALVIGLWRLGVRRYMSTGSKAVALLLR